MPRKCSVCSLPERKAIDEAECRSRLLAESGTPLPQLSCQRGHKGRSQAA